MKIVYQNPSDGSTHDVTNLVSAANWKTERRGAPASMEISLLKTKDVEVQNGGIVSVKDHSNRIFYGYVFKNQVAESGVIKLTAYDQMRYLKNKETYVFKAKRADQIARAIAEDFGLKCGAFENTQHIIASLIQDGKTLLDIILTALDETLAVSHEMFVLWDDFGSLRISSPRKWLSNLVLGDGSLIGKYSYSEDIDSQTFNRIKLVKNNQVTGRRDAYVFQNSDTMRLWGTLQDYRTVDEGLNPAQIEARGDKLLKLHNRPKRLFSISGISDLSVRAGMGVTVDIRGLAKKGLYVIDSCAHDLIKKTMDIKLLVV